MSGKQKYTEGRATAGARPKPGFESRDNANAGTRAKKKSAVPAKPIAQEGPGFHNGRRTPATTKL